VSILENSRVSLQRLMMQVSLHPTPSPYAYLIHSQLHPGLTIKQGEDTFLAVRMEIMSLLQKEGS
jgi:hypothetical protein